MPQSEMGDAVDNAILDALWDELLELKAKVAALGPVVDALEGEWDADDG